MPSVPTTGGVKSAAKTGIINGAAGAFAGNIGRGVLGPGVGTGAGYILGASMLEGQDRRVVATLGVDRAVNEIMGSSVSQTSNGNGGVM